MKRDVLFYLNEISGAKKREQIYRKQAKSVEDGYNATDKRLNLLYSNTETICSALLTALPKPVLRLRYPKEQVKDPAQKAVLSAVGDICEKAVVTLCELSDAKQAFDRAKKDYALVGRATVWAVYEPVIKTSDEGVAYLSEQKITVEYVRWKDFLHSDGAQWSAVWWVARRHWLNREGLKARFGEEGLEAAVFKAGGDEANQTERVGVWELWDKQEKRVVFFTEEGTRFLEVRADPYLLPGFFPCPEPAMSVRSNKDLIPTPEYMIYREDAQSASKICRRMDALVQSINARAFYPAKFKEQMQALTDADEMTYTPVDVSGEMAEKGGLPALIMYEPIEEKQKVIAGLYQHKNNLRADIYEITGIADIMRATSDPRETARAQELKSRFGSLRLQARQAEMNRLVKDAYQIISHLVCEHFEPQALTEITGVQLADDAQNQKAAAAAAQTGQKAGVSFPTWEQVIGLMRNDKLRSYTLDTESTESIFETDETNKARRMELFAAFNDMIGKALPAVAAAPESLDAYREIISFVLEPFKTSRAAKNAVLGAFDQIKRRLMTPKPPQLLPDMVLAQAEMQKAQAQTAKAWTDAQLSAAKLELERAELDRQQQNRQVQVQTDWQKELADLRMQVERLKLEKEKLQAQVLVKLAGR